MGLRANEARSISGGEKDKTVHVLFHGHHEKAGFSGKNNNARKNRRQQGKRGTKYEMGRPSKEAIGMSLQGLGGLLRTGHCGHHSS